MNLARITVPSSTISQPQLAHDGRLRLTGVGIGNLNYIIEFASHLNPLTTWTPIATNTATNAIYEFIERDPPTNSSRFCRVRSP